VSRACRNATIAVAASEASVSPAAAAGSKTTAEEA